MKSINTLAIIEDGDRALLAMKKRGFGSGWWNGFGGKLEAGETIERAMVRELEEESGIVAKKYRERGVINFYSEADLDVEMHIFEVTEYEGEPSETEEMSPKWFLKSEIPYQKMWPGDNRWMPLFFEGKDFTGRIVFDASNKVVLEAKISQTAA